MAKVRVNHFGAKTIDVYSPLDWESIITELFIAFLLGAFAYMGYRVKLAFLFFSCAFISFLIVVTVLYKVISDIKERAALKKIKSEQ